MSISEKAEVNLDYMSDLTGMDKGKLIEDLQGLIYRVPNTENYVTADEYLSGDILEKLNAAKIAFDNGDTSMAVNISALEKAMPERLSASQIDVRLGTTWIKPEYIRDRKIRASGTLQTSLQTKVMPLQLRLTERLSNQPMQLLKIC